MNQKDQMSLNKLVTIFGTEIPFVRLVSILSLIGVGLFFVGWVYRWAYFSFFSLQINSLNLSPQSFLFSPIQVFFGDTSRIRLTILSLILTAIGIYLLVWLYNLFITLIIEKAKSLYRQLNLPQTTATSSTQNKTLEFLIKVLRFLKVKKILRSLLNFSKTRGNSLQILQGLLEEIISVSVVIIVFYWLARTQGLNDARLDASSTSTLPVITLITKENQLPIGSKLTDTLITPTVAPTIAPTTKGFSIIGDRGMFKSIQEKEKNNSDLQNPRVLRLLLEQNGWFYLFHELPPNPPPDWRPLVIALKENQMLILSPEPTQPKPN